MAIVMPLLEYHKLFICMRVETLRDRIKGSFILLTAQE